MARTLRLALMTLTTTLLGCSLLTSLDGFDEGNRLSAEGGEDDASSSGDVEAARSDAWPADEASTDAGVNDEAGSGGLLPNSGFENGSCSPPWDFDPSVTSATSSTIARSGGRSCRVCNIGAPQGSYGLFTGFAPDEWGPGTYTLDMYVRYDGNGGSSTGLLQLTIEPSGEGSNKYPTATTETSASVWTHVAVVAHVGTGEYLSEVLVGGYSDTVGPCLLIDDVGLTRE